MKIKTLIGLIILSPTTYAYEDYSISLIGDDPHNYHAEGINDEGKIVGGYSIRTGDKYNYFAFISTEINGRRIVQNIAESSGHSTSYLTAGIDINNQGDIVLNPGPKKIMGSNNLSNTLLLLPNPSTSSPPLTPPPSPGSMSPPPAPNNHPTTYSNLITYTAIDTPAFNSNHHFWPTHLNDLNQVLGYNHTPSDDYIDSESLLSYVNNSWNVTELNAIHGQQDPYESSYWHRHKSINDLGQIAFAMPDKDPNIKTGYIASKSDTQWNIETFLTKPYLKVNDINNSNQIVGQFSHTTAFIAKKTNNEWLITSFSTNERKTEAIAINDSGVIVGVARSESNPADTSPRHDRDAVIFSDGNTQNLLDLIPSGAEDWEQLVTVKDINDQGQIIGEGRHKDFKSLVSFVMTPIQQDYADDKPECELGFYPESINSDDVGEEEISIWWWTHNAISGSINDDSKPDIISNGNIQKKEGWIKINPKSTTIYNMTVTAANGKKSTCRATFVVNSPSPLCEINFEPRSALSIKDYLWAWSENASYAHIRKKDSPQTLYHLKSDVEGAVEMFTPVTEKETVTYIMTATSKSTGKTATCQTTVIGRP